MEELARRFRRAAEKRSGLRYGNELRQQALQFVEMARAQGWSHQEIADSLDVNAATLSRWQTMAIGTAPSLHEVVVVESGGPVLVMPSGARVEGLSLAELISVLAGLG